ncbi:hypothetical protein PspLS_03040 [Pyricularia sp. CBS 133598]|nr:hypothetical protein PspLS_03040 [Pyricularia sp. CBS 133598]
MVIGCGWPLGTLCARFPRGTKSSVMRGKYLAGRGRCSTIIRLDNFTVSIRRVNDMSCSCG